MPTTELAEMVVCSDMVIDSRFSYFVFKSHILECASFDKVSSSSGMYRDLLKS
jgi:hypothetical protein